MKNNIVFDSVIGSWMVLFLTHEFDDKNKVLTVESLAINFAARSKMGCLFGELFWCGFVLYNI